jgi:hypothetical protein
MRGLPLGRRRGSRVAAGPMAPRLARAIARSMPAAVPLDCVIRFTELREKPRRSGRG